MQEVALIDQSDVFTFCERLWRGEVDVVILLTGVGAEQLLNVAKLRYARDEFLVKLAKCALVTRGPKPTSVLTGWGLEATARAGSPNTWREVLAAIDGTLDVRGKRVAVQEYGVPSSELYEGLESRGADVLPVPVYRWALPDDVEPLEQAITSTIAGHFDVLLFTSASQIQHVLTVANRMNLQSAWLTAAQRCVVGSVGPTCSSALLAAGLPATVEADPPKMGPLVRSAINAAERQGPNTIPTPTPEC
jgi:uroporphyrinogen-III synthase